MSRGLRVPHGTGIGRDRRGFVIARPGDRFHVDVDGTAIDGRYVEVDPPHRIVIAWDRQGPDDASPTLVEITLTPTGGNTEMTVEFLALSAVDADFYGKIWRRYLDQIASALPDPAPADRN